MLTYCGSKVKVEHSGRMTRERHDTLTVMLIVPKQRLVAEPR